MASRMDKPKPIQSTEPMPPEIVEAFEEMLDKIEWDPLPKGRPRHIRITAQDPQRNSASFALELALNRWIEDNGWPLPDVEYGLSPLFAVEDDPDA